MADERSATPRASVVIPHLNTPDMLARCLESVTAQVLDHGTVEIIVVDNGSNLGLDAVKARFETVRFLLEPRAGPGLARNRGVAAATAPVLAFIDADCRAAPGWLQTAVDAIETGGGSVGGDIRIDFADPGRLTGIESYEAVFGFRQQMYIEQKHFSVTANLAMARPLHALVGPFGGIEIAEDIDWGRRAHAIGEPTRYVPAMLVYHPARADFAALARKWQRHVRHDWTEHAAAGRSALAWQARALALLASIPVEAVRFLATDRVAGLRNRLAGVGVLARIRAFRAGEMRRVMTAPAESGGAAWNRQA